ncbi:predicted protein [Nematostella vectensis]|uniref:G-protein coupled receptors family 1 profile domain-containing protein n=1 Tax=Nematostella vectensis TaxID=45351 RepID=A7SHI6_NEMVE|nr:predicted protein [Nematostella vectensis]|eukprot:XP_001628911.1 predicted protein [Nematostella vectensis]
MDHAINTTINKTFPTTDNQSERRYVFGPVPSHIKIIVSTLVILFASLSVVGNSLVMYAIRPPKTPNNRAFSRTTAKMFVRSLVLSDLLCAIITAPLFVTEIHIPITPNAWICHLVRYFAYLFPIITIMNMIVIGIERYCVIFCPLAPPSKRVSRRLVIAAWAVGMLMTFIPNINMKRRRYDIDDDKYTLFCSYDNSTPSSRIANTAFSILIYYLPSIVLTVICIKILRFLKRQKQGARGQGSPFVNSMWRYKGSYMLVSLIFAFILPYLLYFIYFTAMTILKPKVSYVIDFTVRYAAAIIGYANGFLNPLIYLICMQDVRARVKALFTRRRRPPHDVYALSEGENRHPNKSIEKGTGQHMLSYTNPSIEQTHHPRTAPAGNYKAPSSEESSGKATVLFFDLGSFSSTADTAIDSSTEVVTKF